MSRSNPSDNAPNPSTRWFEWTGGNNGGFVRHYDKEAKANHNNPLPFTFIVLDELAKVSGWHEPSESGIYSNEVRDTRQEVMLVRSFKGGELANGLYASIRDRVGNVGGYFQASIYVAYKEGDALRLGNLAFAGAALQSWMEFKRAHRADIYKGAVTITGYTEGKKGSVVYRVPIFAMKALGDASNAQAIEFDKELQAYLKTYLARTREDQVKQVTKEETSPPTDEPPLPHTSRAAVDEAMMGQATAAAPEFDDDIPF